MRLIPFFPDCSTASSPALNRPAVLAGYCAFLVLRGQIRTPVSTRGLNDARKQSMFSRGTISLALVAAMLIASEQSVSATCVLVNSVSQKACAFACCAGKSCCHASQKKTEQPTQPLATAGSVQKDVGVFAPLVSNAIAGQPRGAEIFGFSISEHFRHSPETLALICIRLI